MQLLNQIGYKTGTNRPRVVNVSNIWQTCPDFLQITAAVTVRRRIRNVWEQTFPFWHPRNANYAKVQVAEIVPGTQQTTPHFHIQQSGAQKNCEQVARCQICGCVWVVRSKTMTTMPKWHKFQMLYCPCLLSRSSNRYPSIAIPCTPSHNSSTHLSSHFSSIVKWWAIRQALRLWQYR